MFFSHLKPHTVIELGTYGGGSAIWMADQLKLLDVPAHIYSMDIDPNLLEEEARKLKPDNVTYLEGDCFKIEKTFTSDMLSELPRPWLVIKDSHANVEGILHHFHQFLKEGDYLVVEDTNPYIPKNAGHMVTAFESCPLLGTVKLDKLKKFLFEYEDYYFIDTFLTGITVPGCGMDMSDE